MAQQGTLASDVQALYRYLRRRWAMHLLKLRIQAMLRDDDMLHIWACDAPICGYCAEIARRRHIQRQAH